MESRVGIFKLAG